MLCLQVSFALHSNAPASAWLWGRLRTDARSNSPAAHLGRSSAHRVASVGSGQGVARPLPQGFNNYLIGCKYSFGRGIWTNTDQVLIVCSRCSGDFLSSSSERPSATEFEFKSSGFDMIFHELNEKNNLDLLIVKKVFDVFVKWPSPPSVFTVVWETMLNYSS